jgi:hypothetical protein
MPAGDLVIVAQPHDSIASGVQHVVRALGGGVVWYMPHELATLDVELTKETFNVGHRVVQTILWRVSPEMPLADAFQDDDKAFASAEVAATWLAALHSNGTSAINRFDAEAWYSGLRPQYWRDRLSDVGVVVTSISVGDQIVPGDWQWSPYTTGQPCDLPDRMVRATMASACHPMTEVVTSVSVCGRMITEYPDSNVQRAAEFLHAWGIGLAAIDADRDGRVHRVRVLPVFDDARLLDQITQSLGSYLYDHCLAGRS